jgi:hypothetical protein
MTLKSTERKLFVGNKVHHMDAISKMQFRNIDNYLYSYAKSFEEQLAKIDK